MDKVFILTFKLPRALVASNGLGIDPNIRQAKHESTTTEQGNLLGIEPSLWKTLFNLCTLDFNTSGGLWIGICWKVTVDYPNTRSYVITTFPQLSRHFIAGLQSAVCILPSVCVLSPVCRLPAFYTNSPCMQSCVFVFVVFSYTVSWLFSFFFLFFHLRLYFPSPFYNIL